MSGIYDAIKDVAKVAQQADNIDLYKQLLDISADALELQNQVFELAEENRKLKAELNGEKNVTRHSEGLYITLSDDEQEIHYCSTCWGSDKKLIQLNKENRCWVCEKNWIAAHRSGKSD